jgi:hypothetical protein
MPTIEIDEPKRQKLRSDRDDPKCALSRTENADPMRVKLLTEIELPN